MPTFRHLNTGDHAYFSAWANPIILLNPFHTLLNFLSFAARTVLARRIQLTFNTSSTHSSPTQPNTIQQHNTTTQQHNIQPNTTKNTQDIIMPAIRSSSLPNPLNRGRRRLPAIRHLTLARPLSWSLLRLAQSSCSSKYMVAVTPRPTPSCVVNIATPSIFLSLLANPYLPSTIWRLSSSRIIPAVVDETPLTTSLRVASVQLFEACSSHA